MFKTAPKILTALAMLVSSPTFAFEMGAISPLLGLGQDGVWDRRDEGSFYVLDNDTAPAAVKYYYLISRPEHAGRRKMSVEIDLRDETATTRGGLLFGFKEADKSYYSITLAPNGEMSLVRRNPPGGKVLFKGKAKNVSEGVNTITYDETGGAVRVSVNGLSTLTLDNPDIIGGGVGIIAWGQGEYAFRNFSLSLAR